MSNAHTHLLLSDEEIKALHYSALPFYEHVPVSINYPLRSGASQGSRLLIRAASEMGRGASIGPRGGSVHPFPLH